MFVFIPFTHYLPNRTVCLPFKLCKLSLLPIQNEYNGPERVITTGEKRTGFCSWITSSGVENPELGKLWRKVKRSQTDSTYTTRTRPEPGREGRERAWGERDKRSHIVWMLENIWGHLVRGS